MFNWIKFPTYINLFDSRSSAPFANDTTGLLRFLHIVCIQFFHTLTLILVFPGVKSTLPFFFFQNNEIVLFIKS